MKNKLEQLKVRYSLYNKELTALLDEQSKLILEKTNAEEELKETDEIGVKYVFGATLPTSLGALAALLFPCAMAFSVPSLIVSGCIVFLSAYIAIPNYKKWIKNVKDCNSLDKQVRDLTSRIEQNEPKIKFIEEKLDTTSKLIDTYERSPELCSMSTVEKMSTKNNKITNIEIIR